MDTISTRTSVMKRIAALVFAIAAAVALSISVAPATAYADESIAIEITCSHETVPVGDSVHFEVAVTNTGDEPIRVATLEFGIDGRVFLDGTLNDLHPGDSISRGYDATPSRLPDSGEMQFEARVRTEEGGEFSATASVNVIPSIADCDIVFEDQTYTGSEVTPIPTVTLNGRELEYGTDFVVSGYEDNVEAGEARALVVGRYIVVGGSTWRTFNIVPPTYTLIWLDAQGGELLTRTYAMGEDRPSFEGEAPGKASDGQYTYAFAGWRLKEGSETGSATYEPTYDATPIPKGTLTFDLGGGTLDGRTGTITIEANVGDTIKLPGAPTREGYTFRFWKGSEYAAGAEYVVPEGGHSFTAEWEQNAPDSKQSNSAKPATPATGDDAGMLAIPISIVAGISLVVLIGSAVRRRAA